LKKITIERKTTMKKLIFTLITIALMLALFATSAFAAEAIPSSDGASADTVTEGAAEGTDGGETVTEENIFDTFFGAVREYSGEILSAISALLSGIVILAYRKGILPLLTGGLSAVDSEVKKIERYSQSQSEHTAAIANELNEGLASANALLSSLSERISAAEATYKGTDAVFSVLAMQIESFYEIFMSSSLPVYEKERLAEKSAKMKETLGSVTKEGANE
jgi:hypothetical protein